MVDNSSLFALFLLQVGESERKLEYCRQILCKFDCAAIVFEKKDFLDQFEFAKIVMNMISHITPSDCQIIFKYFSNAKQPLLSRSLFIERIRPLNTTSIQVQSPNHMAVYGLQKYFSQIIAHHINLSAYDGLLQIQSQDKINNTLIISQLKDFLNKHEKYPDNKIISLIFKQIETNKLFFIQSSKIKQLINRIINPNFIFVNKTETLAGKSQYLQQNNVQIEKTYVVKQNKKDSIIQEVENRISNLLFSYSNLKIRQKKYQISDNQKSQKNTNQYSPYNKLQSQIVSGHCIINGNKIKQK